MTRDFSELSTYATVVADPPWPYDTPRAIPKSLVKDGSRLQRGPAETGYDLLTMADLCAMPVGEHVERNAHLYLWFTNAFGEEAHQLARAWGFTPKTIITWVKTRHEDGQPSMKTGYYFRSATEHALFCVRGSLPLQTERALPTAFFHQRLGHSVKPPRFLDMVEECSPPAYLEVFSRWAIPGWDAFGNQTVAGEHQGAMAL